MTAHSKTKRARKPAKDFPLFVHQSGGGRWCKKVRGRHVYFGKVASDPKGEAAIQLWLDQRDDLIAGRTPRVSADGLTVRDLCNQFLTAKEQQRDAGDITPRSFAEYFATCEVVVNAFGKNRLVIDLAADDFQSLRAGFAKQYGVHRLGNEVQRVRTIFKYGYDAGLIDRPVRFGPTFKKPAARIVRAHRQKNGLRMFEANELRQIISTAEQPLRAMILLAANCGFGNNDCGLLPQTAIDLKSGWVEFPRPKTAVERRCKLWPETVKALREAIKQRPKARKCEHRHLVFVTKYGQPWAKGTVDNPISKVMRKLLGDQKLHRPGLGFYALRHTFETIAGESRDQVAVNHIMGHVDATMSGLYRERVSDDRIKDVVDHVHKWLYPKRRVAR